MRALVVGTGFVGQMVCEALQDAECDVQMLHSPRLQGSPSSTIEDVDRDFAASIAALADQFSDVDVVINAAGIPDAGAGPSSELFGANAVVPAVVGRAARAAGVSRYIHVSSAVVQGLVPILSESWDVSPLSPYGESKVLGERLAAAAAPGITTVYRPPSVHAADRRITKALTKIARSPLSSVAGDGTLPTPQARAVNVGRAIAHLATCNRRPPDIVMHPSEGMTTGGLLQALGGRKPRHIPMALAKGISFCAEATLSRIPRGRSHSRRLHMLWFGQGQSRSWLEDNGWKPQGEDADWRLLGERTRRQPVAEENHKPHILFGVTTGIVVQSFFDGQLEMLDENGWKVTVVATEENGARDVVERQGGTFVNVTAIRDASPLNDLRTLVALIRELRERKPDLAVWGTPKVGLLGTLASRLTGGRCIYVLHGLRLETTVGAQRLLLTTTERLACVLAHEVVAVGHDLRKRSVELKLVRPEKIRVLGHGSANGVRAFATRAGSRDRLAIPSQDVAVGFVGRVTRDKGIVELLQAWPEVHKRSGALLVLAGLKERDAFVPPISDLLATTPGVHGVGHLEDLADLYASLDALVLPSYREGLSTVVLEAGINGIPSIVSDAVGASEAVDHERTGLVVATGDIDSLTLALHRLVEDQALRERLGAAAKVRIAERYESQIVHRRWLDFFGEHIRRA